MEKYSSIADAQENLRLIVLLSSLSPIFEKLVSMIGRDGIKLRRHPSPADLGKLIVQRWTAGNDNMGRKFIWVPEEFLIQAKQDQDPEKVYIAEFLFAHEIAHHYLGIQSIAEKIGCCFYDGNDCFFNELEADFNAIAILFGFDWLGGDKKACQKITEHSVANLTRQCASCFYDVPQDMKMPQGAYCWVCQSGQRIALNQNCPRREIVNGLVGKLVGLKD